jgi:hypothetical protein
MGGVIVLFFLVGLANLSARKTLTPTTEIAYSSTTITTTQPTITKPTTTKLITKPTTTKSTTTKPTTTKLITKPTTTKSTTTKPTTTKPTAVTTSDKQVYIAKAHGKKYHYDEKCGNGDYSPIDLKEAKDEGYTPCEKCCN